MATRGFETGRLARVGARLQRHVDDGNLPGAAWAVRRGGQLEVGAVGSVEHGGGRAVGPDTIFRISSMTKPIAAAAALILVEELVLRLDDPVDELLPELADRRVTRDPNGPLDDTVPAERAITLRDLLTFRLGWGFDFRSGELSSAMGELARLELGVGPPMPQGPPPPDEWIRRAGTVPLSHQPGSRWLYHTPADVLGVLIARATDQPFDDVVRDRVCEPLGMHDTGFWVPPESLDRFGPAFWVDPETGGGGVFDPTDGQWATRPAFPSGSAGLVSTVTDYLAFADLLFGGGAVGTTRLLSRATVEAMTTDQLDVDDDVPTPGAPIGSVGWGFGVSVQRRRLDPTGPIGTYGWDGGLGSTWHNDPREGLVGVLLTNQAFRSPRLPPAVRDFWTTVYAAIDD
jgi:CubicO group peptidase (beta-lactamase class C family)